MLARIRRDLGLSVFAKREEIEAAFRASPLRFQNRRESSFDSFRKSYRLPPDPPANNIVDLAEWLDGEEPAEHGNGYNQITVWSARRGQENGLWLRWKLIPRAGRAENQGERFISLSENFDDRCRGSEILKRFVKGERSPLPM